MTLQAKLDNMALKMLHMTSNSISQADKFNANQMRCYALREMMNTEKPMNEMTESELKAFDANIVRMFIFKEWMN